MAKIEKLLKEAKEKHFENGEIDIATVMGAYQSTSLGQKTIRNGIFIATDRRILFFGKRTFGFDLESYTYRNISSIELSKKLTGHVISFFASNNKVSMSMVNIGDIKGFIEYVRGRLNELSLPSQTQVPSELDEIKKLAELLADGILSQDEFDAKKKQLLGI